MSVVISVKVDEEIKAQAQEVAKAAGLTLSSLVNSYLRQIVATRRIEIFAPEPMSEHLESLLISAEQEIANGEVSSAHPNPEEFIAALNS